MYKIGYTEEMLQTRRTDRMKEQQESHEKIAHVKIKNFEEDRNERQYTLHRKEST